MERIQFSRFHFGNFSVGGGWFGDSLKLEPMVGICYFSCPFLTGDKKGNTVNYYYYWETLYNNKKVRSSRRHNNTECACTLRLKKHKAKTDKTERWNVQIQLWLTRSTFLSQKKEFSRVLDPNHYPFLPNAPLFYNSSLSLSASSQSHLICQLSHPFTINLLKRDIFIYFPHFLISHFPFCKIGVELLYHVVLASAVWLNEPAICIQESPPSGNSLPSQANPILLGHHRATSWAPFAIQQLPTSLLFYTQ